MAEEKTDKPAAIPVQPKIKIARRRSIGSGKHLRGNDPAKTHPNILATRDKSYFLTHVRSKLKNPGRKANKLTEILSEAIDHTVTIDGKPSDVTVGQVIVQRLVNEAMLPALPTPADVAMRAREMIFERLEGKPKARVEMTGKDGGPIEKVEVDVVMAKLFDDKFDAARTPAPIDVKAERQDP